MSAEIAPFAFEGATVRTIDIEGEPWFLLRDVMDVLGLSNSTEAVRGLDDDEVSITELSLDGQRRNWYAVSEPGLYTLVGRSRKPEAKAFQRWVRHDVLPEIRRTGTYHAPPMLELDLSTIKQLNSAVALLLEENERKAVEVAALTPRAEAWTAIASAEGDYSVGDAAKMLARAGIATGPQRLFDTLNRLKWTYRDSDGKPRPYAERVEKGYLSEKPQFHYHPGTGERVLDAPQVRVTLKGVERLRQRLGGTTVALRAVNP
jgi:prophage antirepressor-like protein